VARQYWLDLFTVETWQQFLDAGGTISGFSPNRWARVRKMQPGDYLLCYLTGASRFVGVLEVTDQPFQSSEPPIWAANYPSRVNVRVVAQLTPETAVPVHDLLSRFSFHDQSRPHVWTGRFRGSPARWSERDAKVVEAAIMAAVDNPVERPLPKIRKPSAQPVKKISEKLGEVSIPDAEQGQEATGEGAEQRVEEPEQLREATAHTEIQWRLLKLGGDMGLDVWVARNDRSREYNGQRLGDMPRLRNELPGQFDAATQSTIELIDVLWLKGKSIVAAFEVESTTSIYSGLLRMSDLIAMQPNLNIPLYLVAPDDRRQKVRGEITRPTFSQLSPPLKEQCQYLSFSTIRDRLPTEQWLVRNLSPGFITDLAESFGE
jgi:hypothetical protein